MLGHASAVLGQDAPTTSAPGAAAAFHNATAQSDILIVAQPGERSSIDRTTYMVRDNAEARATNTLDMLAQVPFVEVTAAGQVRLLGRSGITILIDGKEVPNPIATLRNLQGSQVTKIEVISNPSAQFAARGAGGIINVVLRRNFASGLGGSATAAAASFRNTELRVSPRWSSGPWSLSGSLGLTHWVAPVTFEQERMAIGMDRPPSTASKSAGLAIGTMA